MSVPLVPDSVALDMDDFREELRSEIEKGQVTLIVGAGVSIAATGNPGLASWIGLLKRGVEECVRVAQPLPPGWAERVSAEIGSTDIEDVLSAATKVEKKLGGPKGGDFAAWLRKTVGSLRARNREVPEALAALGLPLLTTNYDDILEEVTGMPVVTWRDSAQVEHVPRGDERGIVHLHGSWRRPDTVVLGIRSHEEVLRDEHAQTMQRAEKATRSKLPKDRPEPIFGPHAWLDHEELFTSVTVEVTQGGQPVSMRGQAASS